MKKIWPFSFNFVLFAATAFVFPFIVVYYQGLGFSGAQIGILTGITPLVTFIIVPVWSAIADATRRHRLIMSIAIFLGMATLIVFPLATTFLPILLIAIFLNVFLGPIAPFADSATMYMLEGERESYGRVRLGGSIGYGIAAAISGVVIEKFGLRFAFWGCAALFFVNLFVSQKLEYGQLPGEESGQGNIRELLKNPRWRLFLILAFAGGLSLAAFNNYFYPFMLELGASESSMGFALSLGTISEIPTLFFINSLIKRFKSYRLLILAMIITSLRMFLFAASAAPSSVLFPQLLNGLTFPAIWVAGVSYADENAPAGLRTTAQGLFSAMVLGFGLAVGSLMGGPLLESIGGRKLYIVFGLVILSTVILVELMQKRLAVKLSTA